MGHDVGEVDIDNVSLVAGHVGTENLNLADTGTDTGVDTGTDTVVDTGTTPSDVETSFVFLAGPTAPDMDSADVVSLFSDAYTSALNGVNSTGW